MLLSEDIKMLEKMLSERHLPDFKNRDEMLEILMREEYGYMPHAPERIEWKRNEKYIPRFCASKAVCEKIDMTVYYEGKSYTFPFYASIPVEGQPCPFFIHVNFWSDITNRYQPTEEIIDHGYAVLSFCYEDVTSDDRDFKNGIAPLFLKGETREATEPGKIAMWAWAMQRVMDYAETDPRLDSSRAAVCGHSRLGKTALFCGATDERIKLTYSNDSGCSGAALASGKLAEAENIAFITKTFPFWFCENFKKYAGCEGDMPFDQHYLTALVAPRLLYVASAEGDLWADPDSEFMNCVAVSKYYEKLGARGFVSDGELPLAGKCYHDGNVGYHKRRGTHYFSREDWNNLMDFADKYL